jgi:hypothetical protein
VRRKGVWAGANSAPARVRSLREEGPNCTCGINLGGGHRDLIESVSVGDLADALINNLVARDFAPGTPPAEFMLAEACQSRLFVAPRSRRCARVSVPLAVAGDAANSNPCRVG